MGGLRKSLKRAIVAGLVLAAACCAAQAPAPAGRQEARPALEDLKSLDELRQVFNHDAGKIRLVLLLSPT
jgi:hypothetical protein